MWLVFSLSLGGLVSEKHREDFEDFLAQSPCFSRDEEDGSTCTILLAWPCNYFRDLVDHLLMKNGVWVISRDPHHRNSKRTLDCSNHDNTEATIYTKWWVITPQYLYIIQYDVLGLSRDTQVSSYFLVHIWTANSTSYQSHCVVLVECTQVLGRTFISTLG